MYIKALLYQSTRSLSWVLEVLVKCWSSVGQVLVKCWLSVGQVLVKCWSSVGQVLVKCSSSVGQVLVKCWSSVGQVLVKGQKGREGQEGRRKPRQTDRVLCLKVKVGERHRLLARLPSHPRQHVHQLRPIGTLLTIM